MTARIATRSVVWANELGPTGANGRFVTHDHRGWLTSAVGLHFFCFGQIFKCFTWLLYYFCYSTATIPLWNRASTGLELFHVGTRVVPRATRPRWIRARRNDRHLGLCPQSESRHHQTDQSFINGGTRLFVYSSCWATWICLVRLPCMQSCRLIIKRLPSILVLCKADNQGLHAGAQVCQYRPE